MVKYPNEMPKVKQEVGKTGPVVVKTTASIESTPVEKYSIRANSTAKNKKSAGHVGASNVNAG